MERRAWHVSRHGILKPQFIFPVEEVSSLQRWSPFTATVSQFFRSNLDQENGVLDSTSLDDERARMSGRA
jgi:hypothetical protein